MRYLLPITLAMLLLCQGVGWAAECTSYKECVQDCEKRGGGMYPGYGIAPCSKMIAFKLEEIGEKLGGDISLCDKNGYCKDYHIRSKPTASE